MGDLERVDSTVMGEHMEICTGCNQVVAWEDMVSNDITYTVIPGPQWWCLNLIGGGYAGQGTVLPRGSSIDQ